MATREDATLIVQIMQWAAMTGIDDALATIFDDSFDPEKAKASDPAVRKVLNMGETIGTFVKQGLLDRDLVFDLWAMQYSWKRVGPAALRLRERIGEPRMYENYEALARGVPASAGV
jgi:hypothetical protein